MLYIDVPSCQEIARLNTHRSPACISLYVPTTPLTQDIGMSRTELGQLANQAFAQLEDMDFDKRQLGDMRTAMDDLLDDHEFWRFQASSLAVLLKPGSLRTFRLANTLQPSVEVADRFHLKPLLRAVTFPHAALVLSLSQNNARLIEMSADLPPREIAVPNMPADAASAVGKQTLGDRSHDRRIHGSEGLKVRLTQYARQVDAALRPVLAGMGLPLLLAAVQPLASIYRGVNSYDSLIDEGIETTDDRSTPAQVAEAARPLLDRYYTAQLEAWHESFGERGNAGRAYTDLSDVARAATFGAVDALLVDMDADVPGLIGDDGAITLAAEADAQSYDVVDEIAGRAMASGAQVLAVRARDMPDGSPVAAILRYPV